MNFDQILNTAATAADTMQFGSGMLTYAHDANLGRFPGSRISNILNSKYFLIPYLAIDALQIGRGIYNGINNNKSIGEIIAQDIVPNTIQMGANLLKVKPFVGPTRPTFRRISPTRIVRNTPEISWTNIQNILKPVADLTSLYMDKKNMDDYNDSINNKTVEVIPDTRSSIYNYIPNELIPNNIYKYKKGNKIHLNPRNKGKFTDYCGGKVTQECIDRAKRSGNVKLIKRATFAENARKWKK